MFGLYLLDVTVTNSWSGFFFVKNILHVATSAAHCCTRKMKMLYRLISNAATFVRFSCWKLMALCCDPSDVSSLSGLACWLLHLPRGRKTGAFVAFWVESFFLVVRLVCSSRHQTFLFRLREEDFLVYEHPTAGEPFAASSWIRPPSASRSLNYTATSWWTMDDQLSMEVRPTSPQLSVSNERALLTTT